MRAIRRRARYGSLLACHVLLLSAAVDAIPTAPGEGRRDDMMAIFSMSFYRCDSDGRVWRILPAYM